MVALRRNDLLVESVNDELLVFHPQRSEATALNRSAAVVFELCDGSSSVASMKAALDAAGLGPASDDAVWLALTDLSEAGLVELLVSPPSFKGRRELITQFGLGAAALVALPVVETIKAPAAAAQGSSPFPTPAPTQFGSGGGLPTPAPATPAPSVQTFSPTAAPTPAPATPAPATPAPATPAPTTPAPTPAPTAPQA